MSEVKRINIRDIGNHDATLDAAEVKEIEQGLPQGYTGDIQLLDADSGKAVNTTVAQLANLLNTDLSKTGTSDASAIKTYLQDKSSEATSQMETAAKQLEEAKKQNASAEVIKERQQNLATAVKNAEAASQKAGTTLAESKLAAYKNAAGSGDGETRTFKAQSTSGGAPSSSPTSTGSSSSSSGSGAKAATLGGSSSGSSGASSAGSGFKSDSSSFDTSTYLNSMNTTDSIISSWDEVNKNVNKGKQLVQLFNYYARMAESGDMGSMYQFMKFITYIVSKDKAKQQIDMGKKLIELQDLQRTWTDKLTNLSTSSDTASSNELMKTMTIVKSETDAIATSQKLISQMMEEFAQVVEQLTNLTKSALETQGRISRTVSQIR